MKVLIAEDNPIWRQMLKQNVSNWGYEPVVAEDGKEAWKILQLPDAPRLAVLDWQMPHMDGIDVCRHVKSSQTLPFTYVVMLTSRDAEEDMVAGLDAGADDYLTKPVEPKILRSRLVAAQRIVEAVPPREWALPRVPGYEVKRLLGKGAFATVWEAMQNDSGRPRRAQNHSCRPGDRRSVRSDSPAKSASPSGSIIPTSPASTIAASTKHIGYYAMELIDGLTLDKYVKYSSRRWRRFYAWPPKCAVRSTTLTVRASFIAI